MLKIGSATKADRIFDFGKHEVDRNNGKMRVASAQILNKTQSLDISWFPLAAEQYKISPRLSDYVITEVPIVTVDVPNRNMDCFPFEEISRFSVEAGRAVYQTFTGKPTYIDHNNQNPLEAKGVHFDTTLQKMANGQYKIVVLCGWDRTKDHKLATEIESGRRTGYSMGAYVASTTCSFPGCNAKATDGRIPCIHQDYGRGKGQVISGNLVYELCDNDVVYFETSSVGDAADHTAIHNWVKPF